MKRKRKYKSVGQVELTPEIDAVVDKHIEMAEKDLEEIRVNFRWGKSQLETVKQAAQAIGVPYQTYIKLVVFRQSLQDLKDLETAVGSR